MAISPDEANPPLIVNANGVLPLSIAVQGFQLVPRRRRKHAQFRRGMHLEQFPQGYALEGSEAP
jgi:hypothetical protein